MIEIMSRIIGQSALPASVPVTYLATFDILNDPMKLAGFIVLVLQGIYILIKIWGEMRGKNKDEN